jgi:hypothetical protein
MPAYSLPLLSKAPSRILSTESDAYLSMPYVEWAVAQAGRKSEDGVSPHKQTATQDFSVNTVSQTGEGETRPRPTPLLTLD